MQRREFLVSSVMGSVGALVTRVSAARATRKMLIAGGNYNTAFGTSELTGKTRPKLCFLPRPQLIRCKAFELVSDARCSTSRPACSEVSSRRVSRELGGGVCPSTASSSPAATPSINKRSGAQGIDAILRQAWDRGIVLGGASAGSLCWFEEGTTDSRPKDLSKVDCLGFLKGSHSPHYDAEPGRRPLYQKLIGSGEMKPGYACDNDAGIFFEDNVVRIRDLLVAAIPSLPLS
jgi:hypothetical protein